MLLWKKKPDGVIEKPSSPTNLVNVQTLLDIGEVGGIGLHSDHLQLLESTPVTSRAGRKAATATV